MLLTRRISASVGWVLILLALIGCFISNILGMHLNTAHNMLLLATGVISLLLSAAEITALRVWCLCAGLIYTCISIAGLLAPAGAYTVGVPFPTSHLLKLVPGVLEFGTADNCWQLIMGLVFLIGGIAHEAPPARLKESRLQREKTTLGGRR